MKNILQIIDSLLGAVTTSDSAGLPDSTMYQVETTNNIYVGYIIFQDDIMIKFRTAGLKPVKILKENIRKVSIVSEVAAMKYATI